MALAESWRLVQGRQAPPLTCPPGSLGLHALPPADHDFLGLSAPSRSLQCAELPQPGQEGGYQQWQQLPA